MSLKGSIFEPMFGESSPVDEVISTFDELYEEARQKEEEENDPYGNGNAGAYAKSMVEDRLQEKRRRKQRREDLIDTVIEVLDDPKLVLSRLVKRGRFEGKARLLRSIEYFEDLSLSLTANFWWRFEIKKKLQLTVFWIRWDEKIGLMRNGHKFSKRSEYCLRT